MKKPWRETKQKYRLPKFTQLWWAYKNENVDRRHYWHSFRSQEREAVMRRLLNDEYPLPTKHLHSIAWDRW